MEDVHVRQDAWAPGTGPDAVWDEQLLAYADAVGVREQLLSLIHI